MNYATFQRMKLEGTVLRLDLLDALDREDDELELEALDVRERMLAVSDAVALAMTTST